MDTDPHTLLIEANAQLNGIRNLTAEAPDEPLSCLSGYELYMLLEPITERLKIAIELIGNS